MSKQYTAAVACMRPVMDAVEHALAGIHPERGAVALRRTSLTLPVGLSDDQWEAAVLALESLGILESHQGVYTLLPESLAQTADYRRGLRQGLDEDLRLVSRSPVLAAAVPVSISAPIAASLRAGFADLRAELVNLMAATQEELILASPFWDAETVDDLGELLARRLAAGVRVKILCRGLRSDASGEALRALSKRLRASSGLEIFEWFSPDAEDALGSSTFHAKIAVADGGTRAYVGSANFTISGLRSRYEVGVLLEGVQAQRIWEAMATILKSVAQRCESLHFGRADHP